MKTSIVKKFSRTVLVSALTCALPALAGPDNVGLGTGWDGPLANDANYTSNKPINQYARLTDSRKPGAKDVQVDDATGFKPGQLVLVLQTTNSTSDKPEDPKPLVGRWEFARIDEVVNKTLTFTEPLLYGYTGTGAQAIRVPEYTEATITKNLSPMPWNRHEGKGGVLAFLVNGDLQIDRHAAINAKGMGFQGGSNKSNQTCSPGIAAPRDTNGDGLAGGGRGTGDVKSLDQWFAATPCTKFGGGGGGGNGGAGGQGGVRNLDDSHTLTKEEWAVRGQGGAKLSYEVDAPAWFGDRLLMGSGGGAGYAADEPGGAGGGIIFIRANTLRPSGVITAAGEGNKGNPDSGSGSGGGAGGTLYLRIVDDIAECGRLKLQGGLGGDAQRDMGPGGGGAGGWILFQRGSSPNCTMTQTLVSAGGQGKIHGGATHFAGTGSHGVITDLNNVNGVNDMLFETNENGEPTKSPTPRMVKAGQEGKTLASGFLVLPKPVVEEPAMGSDTQDTTPQYSGVLAPPSLKTDQREGTRVRVYVDGIALDEEPTLSANGKWSVSHPPSRLPLPPGKHEVQAVAINDDQGVQSLKSEPTAFTVVAPAPEVVRDLIGGGVGCGASASGGAPSGLALMGLALLSTLRGRRRQR